MWYELLETRRWSLVENPCFKGRALHSRVVASELADMLKMKITLGTDTRCFYRLTFVKLMHQLLFCFVGESKISKLSQLLPKYARFFSPLISCWHRRRRLCARMASNAEDQCFKTRCTVASQRSNQPISQNSTELRVPGITLVAGRYGNSGFNF